MPDAAAPAVGETVSLADLDPGTRIQVVAKAFSALADPVRLQIVQLLAERDEATVGELAAALPVSQPRVSVHLRCLTDCGYTTARRQGRRSYYRLTGPHVGQLVETVRHHAEAALPGLLACLECETQPSESCC